MRKSPSDILVVYDNQIARDHTLGALQGYYAGPCIHLDKLTASESINSKVSIFCVNAGNKETLQKVKKALGLARGETVFVLATHNSEGLTRLREITEAEIMVLPVDGDELRQTLKKLLNRAAESAWQTLEPKKQKALKKSVVCFERCFDRVQKGEPIPLNEIRDCCCDIRDAAALGDLNTWIDALDNHHDYSFRHSMFVCGSLTYFAHAIGIRGGDLDQLTVGGLLHDVGKALIPTKILDKPGKLADDEWLVMKQHPLHSKNILFSKNNLDPNIVAMAVSHHEKIDGSGYPNGLNGMQINDHVRLTAIADVYSALIDKRAYKGSMSSAEALEMMSSFKGHLDMDLLKVFKGFVLDQV